MFYATRCLRLYDSPPKNGRFSGRVRHCSYSLILYICADTRTRRFDTITRVCFSFTEGVIGIGASAQLLQRAAIFFGLGASDSAVLGLRRIGYMESGVCICGV